MSNHSSILLLGPLYQPHIFDAISVGQSLVKIEVL